MTDTSQTPRLAMVLVVLGLASALALQVARERWYPDVASPVDELYFTSGDAVGRMALSYKSLLADIYWIRAIQYFAATRLENRPVRGTDLLYPLLDVTTTLDPSFNIAYRFGAIFLSEMGGSGLGRPDLGLALLDKGFEHDPQKWQYLYDKAFIYYWTYGDYTRAAHWFSKASEVAHSPEWLPGLAAHMLAQGGNRQSSRFLFRQILDTAEHEYMRTMARVRLEQLDILDGIDQLNLVLDRYAQRTGAHPTTWQPLIAAGWIRGVPIDPGGTALVIDPTTGHATVAVDSKYYPLPVEPKRATGASPAPAPSATRPPA